MDNSFLSDAFLRSWFPLAVDEQGADDDDPSSYAFTPPENLKDRLLAGEHPLEIWAEHEGLNLGDLAHSFHMPYQDAVREQRNPVEPFCNIRGFQILNFCRRIGVHPAHLVPLDDNPQLSLPRCILEANIMVAQDKAEKPRNQKLAEQAIACELKRYSRFLKYGNQGTGLSYMFAQAMAEGYYDQVYTQLDAHSHDKRQEAFNVAPLLLVRLSVDKQNELDRLLGSRDVLGDELELADSELDRAYDDVFGPVTDGRCEIVTAYALSLRDRYPREMTDRQLRRNAYGSATMNSAIYDLIAEDVTRLSGQYCADPITPMNAVIHKLADSVRAYWQAQAKLDLFNEENGEKIEALEMLGDYIAQCTSIVSSGEGDIIRRMFVNYGVIKSRHERNKAQTTVCALLKPPAAE